VILNRIDFSNNLFILDAIVFFASLILISNGVLGKYLAAVYTESKDRPKYVIKEFLNNDIRA
ncbi:MAG: hypothetical protein J6Z79_05070, partial [Clostridia bacterium]|nr:hypothetical protein [Clostridia bacterium]